MASSETATVVVKAAKKSSGTDTNSSIGVPTKYRGVVKMLMVFCRSDSRSIVGLKVWKDARDVSSLVLAPYLESHVTTWRRCFA